MEKGRQIAAFGTHSPLFPHFGLLFEIQSAAVVLK
jgi:hypothetical protein